jgi:hypothetical protein
MHFTFYDLSTDAIDMQYLLIWTEFDFVFSSQDVIEHVLRT